MGSAVVKLVIKGNHLKWFNVRFNGEKASIRVHVKRFMRIENCQEFSFDICISCFGVC